MASFHDLPDELLLCIINQLPTYHALRSFGKVSRRLRRFVEDPRVIVDWLLHQHDLDHAMAFLTIGNDHGHLPVALALQYLQHLLERPHFILPRYLYQLALEATEPESAMKELLREHAKRTYPTAYWETDDLLNSAEHPADIAIYAQSMLGYSSFPIQAEYIQRHYPQGPLQAIRSLMEEVRFNVHFDLSPWRGCTFGAFEDGQAILEKAIASGHQDAVLLALQYADRRATSFWLTALSKAYTSFEGSIFVFLLDCIQQEDAESGFWSHNDRFPLQKRQESLLDFLANSAKNNVVGCFCTLLQAADMLSIPAAQSQRIWLIWSIRHWDKYSQILIFVERLLMVQQRLASPTHAFDSTASPMGFSHLSAQTALIDHVKPLLSRLYFQMSTLTRVPS